MVRPVDFDIDEIVSGLRDLLDKGRKTALAIAIAGVLIAVCFGIALGAAFGSAALGVVGVVLALIPAGAMLLARRDLAKIATIPDDFQGAWDDAGPRIHELTALTKSENRGPKRLLDGIKAARWVQTELTSGLVGTATSTVATVSPAKWGLYALLVLGLPFGVMATVVLAAVAWIR